MTGDQASSNNSIAPQEAVEMYLSSRRNELAEASLQNIRYRLKQFRIWADETGINEIGEINGMLCEKYKLSRVDDGLASTTIQQQMRTFRHFVRWCESVELIEQGTSELIRIPKTNKDEQARDASIEPERARAILSYIEQFEYATL